METHSGKQNPLLLKSLRVIHKIQGLKTLIMTFL